MLSLLSRAAAWAALRVQYSFPAVALYLIWNISVWCLACDSLRPALHPLAPGLLVFLFPRPSSGKWILCAFLVTTAFLGAVLLSGSPFAGQAAAHSSPETVVSLLLGHDHASRETMALLMLFSFQLILLHKWWRKIHPGKTPEPRRRQGTTLRFPH